MLVRRPRGEQAVRLITDLGSGESEVLMLGLELPDAVLVLDDALARRVAASLDLRFTGTLGLLLDAKRLGSFQPSVPCWISCKNSASDLPHTPAEPCWSWLGSQRQVQHPGHAHDRHRHPRRQRRPLFSHFGPAMVSSPRLIRQTAGNGAGQRTHPDERDSHSMTAHPSWTPFDWSDKTVISEPVGDCCDECQSI